MDLPLIFAATLNELPEHARGSRIVASDMTLILGAIALLVAAIFVWVAFIRGPRKHPEVRNRKVLEAKPNPNVTVTEDGRERHRKKRREKRREHRQRNPTLDQTGGLPPPRDPQESPSV